MKPYYLSTKKESNHHPLIEAISWLKAYVKRFIEKPSYQGFIPFDAGR